MTEKFKNGTYRLFEMGIASLLGVVVTLAIAYLTVGASMLNERDIQRISRNTISDSLSVIVERSVLNAIRGKDLVTENDVKQIVKEGSPWVKDKEVMIEKFNALGEKIDRLREDLRDIRK